jgi:copper transport protein
MNSEPAHCVLHIFLRWLVLPAVMLITLLPLAAVQAHAVLQRSDPPANATLTESPRVIALWFSEPVEPKYSSVTLRDSEGNLVVTAPSVVPAGDPYQLSLQPGELADGLYTVVWHAVSVVDGHSTAGSFPFVVGTVAVAAVPAATAASAAGDEQLPQAAAIVRWFNLLALTLGAGAAAFAVLVWRPARLGPLPRAERRLDVVIWTGWLLMGMAGVLMLWLQIAVATQSVLWPPPQLAAAADYAAHTRYGGLWLARTGLWLLMGVLLLFVHWRWAAWAVVGCAAAILALTSMFSHAGALRDATGAIAADWLHLVAAAVWIGGLVQLAVVAGPLRGAWPEPGAAAGRLVARFSNVARVAVAALIISGAVALWLQVGSLDALLDTTYGRILLFKLLLVIPLLALAAVNLLVTQGRLQEGKAVWIGRLRMLVGCELALLALILLATAALTAMNPARNVLMERANAAASAAAAQQAAPQQAAPQQAAPQQAAPQQAAATPEQAANATPYAEMQMVDDLHVTLTITPGRIGENNFSIALNHMDGSTVTDARLIRLRFEHQEQDLGESELRIGPNADGVYEVRGANLSVPGPWRIRISVQRPDQYDAVVDFLVDVQAPPQ